MKNLTKCGLNEINEVCDFDPSAPVRERDRLLELGFTQGQKVKIVRLSLAKNTFLVEIRGYLLSLRRSVAEIVRVK